MDSPGQHRWDARFCMPSTVNHPYTRAVTSSRFLYGFFVTFS